MGNEKAVREIREQIDDIEKSVMGEAVLESTRRERRWHDKQHTYRCLITSAGLVIATLIICATVYCTTVFKEQQYANNMQYNDLMDFVNGLTTVETGDNGVIIQGDENSAAQGDVNNGANN